MKHLYLYRHADTLPAEYGQTDHSRVLSDQGRDECQRVGNFLKLTPEFRPGYALCSTATRTRDTLALTAAAMEHDFEVRHDDALYLASAGDIFHLINQVDDSVDELLVVSHNPGIHHFCQILAKRGDRVGRQEIDSRFPPATLALFKVNIAHWAELSPETIGELLGVAIPKQQTA